MTKPSVVDEIAALIPERVGTRPWWERVDPQHESTLAEILEAWRAGTFGGRRRTAAKAISAALKRRGVDIGEQGVETWLKRQAG